MAGIILKIVISGGSIMRITGTKNKISTTNTKSAAKIFEALEMAYPAAHCALIYKTPFQLLIATILSAQCTDKRVNMVTPVLFERYGTARDLAGISQEHLETIIRSTGFFRNKAKNIIGCCKKIVEDYKGEVPDTMAQLITLPGVARKTANVVLYNAFGKAEGVVVDTHVLRIARRLGLTRSTKPELVERDLMKILPSSKWGQFSHLLIDLGRDVCKAPNPNCTDCKIIRYCPWNRKTI